MLRFHFHIQCLYTVFLTVTCISAQHIANMAQVWVMSRITTSSNLSSTKIFIYFFIYSAYPVQSVLLLCCKILAAAALGGGRGRRGLACCGSGAWLRACGSLLWRLPSFGPSCGLLPPFITDWAPSCTSPPQKADAVPDPCRT